MSNPPDDQSDSPRGTAGREEQLGRTPSRASGSRLEISARRNRALTPTERDRLVLIPEGQSPNPSPSPGPHPRPMFTADVRQCWICFLTEDDDKTMEWVKPCICRGTMQWVHQVCLQQWIDRRYNEEKVVSPFCPHCRTKYVIYYPKLGPLSRCLEAIDKAVEAICPYIVGTVVVGSLYWTALCIGASAFLEAGQAMFYNRGTQHETNFIELLMRLKLDGQAGLQLSAFESLMGCLMESLGLLSWTQRIFHSWSIGDSEAKEILENGKPLILMLTLPIIPAAVIGLGMLEWEDMTLEFLRTVTEYVPLTGYVLPTRVRNVSGIFHNRQISDGMTCTRVFAGASILPLASKWCGDTLYSSVPSPFWRSFYGCITFVGVKGLIIMYHKQQWYKRMSRRMVLDRIGNADTNTVIIL